MQHHLVQRNQATTTSTHGRKPRERSACRFAWGAISIAGPLLLASCTSVVTEYKEGHCANHDGDAFCNLRHGPVAPYCTLPLEIHCRNAVVDGCVPTPPTDPVCYSPCGEMQNLAELPLAACSQGLDAVSGSTTSTSGDSAEASTESTTEGDATHMSGMASSEGTDAPGAGECGDGVVDEDEVCDDGTNEGGYEGCNPGCQSRGPYCGDEIVDDAAGETCDRGTANGTQACSVRCRIPGTVVRVLDETLAASSPNPEGIRATRWHERLAVVFGGSDTTVWQIDRATRATYALRNVNVEHSVLPLAGAVGLGDAGLLVVGGHWWRRGYRFDEDLDVTWSYADETHAEIAGFVGAAAMGDDVVLGGLEVHYAAGDEFSSYWAIGMTNTGEPLWNGVETLVGTHEVLGRDLRGIGGDRAVLLTDTADGPSFRIFAGHGELEAETQVTDGNWESICAGDGGFFLLGRGESTLLGFDADGEAAFDVPLPDDLSVRTVDGGIGCVARPDRSPILAITDLGRGGSIVVLGFAGSVVAWRVELEVPCPVATAPALHLDEEHGQVWVLTGGATNADTRCVHTAVVAI